MTIIGYLVELILQCAKQPEQKAIDHVSFCYQINTLSCWVSPNKNECVTYIIIPTLFNVYSGSGFSILL